MLSLLRKLAEVEFRQFDCPLGEYSFDGLSE
jgi:hypothetical protein